MSTPPPQKKIESISKELEKIPVKKQKVKTKKGNFRAEKHNLSKRLSGWTIQQKEGKNT